MTNILLIYSYFLGINYTTYQNNIYICTAIKNKM